MAKTPIDTDIDAPVMTKSGNLIHSVHVFSLPQGPIWVFHTFHLVTTGLMLLWYLRFELLPRQRIESEPIVDDTFDDLLMTCR